MLHREQDTLLSSSELFNRFCIPMWISDPKGHVIFYNQQWIHVFGTRELSTLPLEHLRHVRYLSVSMEDLRQALNSGHSMRIGYYTKKVNSVLNTEYQEEVILPYKENSMLRGFIGFCFDSPSTHGEGAREIESCMQKLIETNESLTHEVHHRVRNNLQVILSLINLYKRFNGEECFTLMNSIEHHIRVIGIIHHLVQERYSSHEIPLRQFVYDAFQGFQSLMPAMRCEVAPIGDEKSVYVTSRIAQGCATILAVQLINAPLLQPLTDIPITCSIVHVDDQTWNLNLKSSLNRELFALDPIGHRLCKAHALSNKLKVNLEHNREFCLGVEFSALKA